MAIGLLKEPPPRWILAADAACESRALRQFRLRRGAMPSIPNNPIRKHHQPFNRSLYSRRDLFERSFRRLKDVRRIATRCDKLGRNFLAGLCLVLTITTGIE